MGDLYEVLGVGRDATKAEIEAAYREAARKSHPDHGGDAARFRAVTAARELLVCPERRARYDETGETAQGPKVGASRAEQFLASMVAQAFLQDGKHPVRWMGDQIDGRRANTRTSMLRARNDRERLAKRLAKFRKENGGAVDAPGRELIEGVIESGIAEFDRGIASMEESIADCVAALELLNGLESGRETSGWSSGLTAGQWVSTSVSS